MNGRLVGNVSAKRVALRCGFESACAAAAAALRRAQRIAGACAAARVGAVAAPEADDRGRDEHARVGAGDDADDHREREPVQHLAAEEEQRQRGQQRRARR